MVSDAAAPGGRDRGPLVSIVLPTYSGDRYLAEAIASCLQQTFRHLELLVVDDGSSANIYRIVEAAGDGRARYLRHAENAGLPRALNTGFAEARGGYLTWTSDDNRYHPEAMARMVEYLEAHPEIGLVYAGCRLIDERGTPGGPLPLHPPETLWSTNCVGPCFLYRRQVYQQVGTYDPEVALVEDYDYWLRTARLFRLGRLEEILYDLRVHPTSLTRSTSLDRKRTSHLRILEKMLNGDGGPPVPRALWRRARAAMHATYGRDYFFAGQTGQARRDLWAAIRLQPSHLLDWGIVGALVKSLLSDRLLSFVRASRRRKRGRTEDGAG